LEKVRPLAKDMLTVEEGWIIYTVAVVEVFTVVAGLIPVLLQPAIRINRPREKKSEK
jgi:hypothetical protein